MAAAPSPMLAALGAVPTEDDWAIEFKWDGARAIAEMRSGTTQLFSRNSNDVSSSYPELVTALPAAVGQGRSVVVDGEIVALDSDGRPSFSLLQRRMHVLKPTAQLIKQTPVSYFAFDVLDVDGRDTTSLTYLERRELLDELALSGTIVQTPPYWTGVDSAAMLDIARHHGLEGIVTKRVTSSYQPGRRSPAWRKIPIRRGCEAVVGGFVSGSGTAAGGIGSLLLGAHNAARELVYIGQVGTGFTAKDRRELLVRLEEMEQADPPFAIPPPGSVARVAHWVRPELVGDIQYREFTDRLRHPSWRGLRGDKTVTDVSWPGDH